MQEIQSLQDKLRNCGAVITKARSDIQYFENALVQANEEVETQLTTKCELENRLSAALRHNAVTSELPNPMKPLESWIQKFHDMMSRGAEHVSSSDLNLLFASVPSINVKTEDDEELPADVPMRPQTPEHRCYADNDGFGRPLHEVSGKGSASRSRSLGETRNVHRRVGSPQRAREQSDRSRTPGRD